MEGSGIEARGYMEDKLHFIQGEGPTGSSLNFAERETPQLHLAAFRLRADRPSLVTLFEFVFPPL
jgi:hypothetical protein